MSVARAAVPAAIRAFDTLADAAPHLTSAAQAELKYKRNRQAVETATHQLKLTRIATRDVKRILVERQRAARARRKESAVAPDVVGVLRTLTESVRIVKDLTGTPVPIEHAAKGRYLLITTRWIDVRGQGRTVGRYQVALPLSPDQICMHTRGWALDGQHDLMNPTYDHPNISPTTRWFCLNQYGVYIRAAIHAKDLLRAVALVIDALIEGPRDIYLTDATHRIR